MADRFWEKYFASLLCGWTNIPGSWAPNGSSAVSSSSVKGKGFTIAYISTGLFRITFADQYPGLIAATGTVQSTSAAARFLQFGDYVAASRTLDVRTVDGSGVVQDISANANNRVHFNIVFTNSVVDL